jgi:purine-binding chemotaxis protein CheW
MQILRVPLLTKVPMTADSIRGFCPINGNVVTVLDSLSLLTKGNSKIDATSEQARILTIRIKDIVIALMVQEVIENLAVTEDNIEFSEASKDDPVVAIMKASDDIVQVLSIERLFANVKLPKFDKNQIHDAHHKDSAVQARQNFNYKKLLFFTMNSELFAVDIDIVQEIIDPIEKYTPIADAPNYVLGLFTLREYTVLTVDYRKCFGFKAINGPQNRVIIISHKSRPLGLLVDGIIDIKDIDENLIEALPEKKVNDKISGVTKLQNRLVSIISTASVDMLAEEMRFTIPKRNLNHAVISEHEEVDKGVGNMELVVFTLGREEYAFSIDDVEEIIRYSEVTKLSEAPRYVKGIINLRGTVIPVVSLHERLGFNGDIHEDTKILVCRIHNKKVGFLVDNVSEVLEIEDSNIASSEHKNALFSHVIILDGGKRMILKLATEELLDKEQTVHFAQDRVHNG